MNIKIDNSYLSGVDYIDGDKKLDLVFIKN